MTELSINVANLAETEKAGKAISKRLRFPACVYLVGEMAAGKTTLCKSIINAFGYRGEVTSPTYNLIQEYPVQQGVIYHMDLYRLEDASELEFLAIEDLWSERSLFLIEWPENGLGHLRSADFNIAIAKSLTGSASTRHIVLGTLS